MATIYCPKCGTPNDSSSTFCGNCGYTPQASGAGTFYPPQGQQSGVNVPPPPPPPFRSGSMPSSPAYPPGATPLSPTYATSNMPSSPTYSAGNMPPSPAFPTSNMPAPPTYPMSSTPSSPTYPTGTMPSSTYAGGGTNLPPQQPRRGKKGIIAILAVVVLVILVGAGLVGFLEYKSHNTPGVASKPTATPRATPTPGVTTTPDVTATTSTTATPGATVTTGATATPGATPTPGATTANYAAPQPGPGCDTGGGTWTPQDVNNISCGTTVSPTASGTWGYLYLQLPGNAPFSANNKITVSDGNINSGYGRCVGLAEQDANTGFLVSYCDSGTWTIASISNKGTIIRTLSTNVTSTRSTTTISLALVNNTLTFTIDAETHQVTVSPLQPVKVAIAYYDSGYLQSISTNNFSYITPAS